MSAVELSGRASADLLDIYLQGIRLFGPKQADHYLDDLESCFEILAQNPRMGRRADRLLEESRCHEHMAHVVFYRETEGGILVLAILHSRQLPDLDGL